MKVKTKVWYIIVLTNKHNVTNGGTEKNYDVKDEPLCYMLFTSISYSSLNPKM